MNLLFQSLNLQTKVWIERLIRTVQVKETSITSTINEKSGF